MIGGGSPWREWERRYFQIPLPVRVVWAVVLTYLLTDNMASTRGGAVALFAAVFYGGVFVAGSVSPNWMRRWGRRHPWLDRSPVGPAVFLALAAYSHLALLVCALVGSAAYAFLVSGIVLRRRGEALA